MKINSNTISLDMEEYAAVEKVIEKIASDNQIDNVKEVRVVLSPESGTIKFKSAEDMGNGNESPVNKKDIKEETCSEAEKKDDGSGGSGVPDAERDEDEG